MISKEAQKNLPEDENTPEKRADKIWDFFGKKENGEIKFCVHIKKQHYYKTNIYFLEFNVLDSTDCFQTFDT